MDESTKSRRLGFEALEHREYLSVSPLLHVSADYAQSDWFEQRVCAPAPPQNDIVDGSIVENEWLIQLNGHGLQLMPSVSTAADHLQPYGISVIGGLGLPGMLHVSMDTGPLELQSEVFAGLPYVESYAPNQQYVADGANSYAEGQWYLNTINVGPAWDTATGSGTVVAVMDTGIKRDHPDLQSQIWVNSGVSPAYPNDTYGWNVAGNNNNTADAGFHGTAVAGVVAGVAPDTKILPIRISQNGSTTNDAWLIGGINYATLLKNTRDVNICAINISWGGAFNAKAFGSTVFAAAEAAGIVIVWSAGNSKTNADAAKTFEPVNVHDNIIVVAATDKNDQLSSFSNYGATGVDLAAPGSAIWTTTTSSSLYGTMNGTSFAAPMVSAAVALLAEKYPTWLPAQIKQAILATVDPLPTLQGKVVTEGRLNIGDAVDWAQTPAAPTGLTATAKNSISIDLSWKAVSGATSYRVEYSTDKKIWQDTSFGAATSGTIGSLSEGTGYHFRVYAVNGSGESKSSLGVSAATMVGPPRNFQGTAESHNTVHLRWDAVPLATSYVIERSVNGTTWTKITVRNATEYTNRSLSAGTTYQYRISAVTSAWTSETSTVISVTTKLAAPGTPTLKVGGINVVTVTWKAVTGATGYLVQRSLDGKTDWTPVTTTEKLTYSDATLAANTTYFYQVQALAADASLNSVFSSSKKAKTTTAPLASIAALGYNYDVVNGVFGVALGIKTPEMNDKSKVLPTGGTYTYEVLVAGPNAKINKSTGLLEGAVSLGTVTLTPVDNSKKPGTILHYVTNLLPFGDLNAVGDLLMMNRLQFQLSVSYSAPALGGYATLPTKAARLALPKWI